MHTSPAHVLNALVSVYASADIELHAQYFWFGLIRFKVEFF